jgi:hypothetical protein
MFRKIFTFSNATLLVALTLSTIAAWYSIVGLTAIFAGAVIPIIIMGSALELGKIVTTVWLRKYWYRCSIIMKLYLVPAVFFLAVLTSMGIFGFLSKAHMDQGIVSGDAVAKVSLYDEKISIQKDIVKSSKSMLAQMDQQVNDIMTKGDSEKSVERSVAIRKQQAKERASLQKDIENANKEIQRLNEERAPLAAETRKIEAEVGPIKYIAALIYGDNADANMLEAAVRWVIIMLVAVFDPLALVLVVAANQSKEWDENIEEESKLKEQVEHEKVMADLEGHKPDAWVADVGEKPTLEEIEDYTEINHELQEARVVEEPFVEEVKVEEEGPIADKHPYLNQPFKHFENLTPMVSQKEEVKEVVVQEEPVAEVPSLSPNPEPQILAMGIDDVERPGDYVTPPSELETEGITEEPFKKLDGGYIEFEGKKMHERVLQTIRPDLFAILPDDIDTNFGTNFPQQAMFGSMFVRTDFMPHRLFKFNGRKWIEVNKETTDTYLSANEYVQFLVDKLATGEYDPEMLTQSEQDVIQGFLESKSST